MSESALSTGSLIAGRYRLEEHLGEGGMGTVWAAIHTVTRRSVAMKFLRDGGRAKGELRQRFLREASAASALKHPNVVEIIDVFDFDDQSPVMVMELLQGETLGKKLARDERLSLEETAALLLPVVSAVGTAHSLGIVHRDLKPENLFIERRGDETAVKVLDFGIAKLSAERYLERGLADQLTDTGSMLGTPCYMAPEQATGEKLVDHRADIWSLGVILYECLSGTRPIEGENLAQVITRLVSAGIIPLERLNPELPHEVATFVMQMLSREPARRPQDLRELSKILSAYAPVRPPAFGVPSGNPPAELPQARVVSGRGADPQGPTLLSSPPVNSSVKVTLRSPKSKLRQKLTLGAFVGFVVLMVVLSALRIFDEKGPSGVASSEAPLGLGSSSEVTNRAPEAPSSAPELATAAVTASAKTDAAKKPAPIAGPRLKPPPARPPAARPAADDDALFSGRK
jgi:serine/threonine protein kinase